MSTRTRQDWILWAQLGCALVATAHAEYTLALATGLHWVVAGAVPGALDLYVIRALQKHHDVLPAVLVMVAANVASILVQASVLPLHWGLYSAVGALVPLLVWRGHVLRVQPGTPVPETAPADVPVQVSKPGAVSAPVPGPSTRVAGMGYTYPAVPAEQPCPHSLPEWACPECAPVPELAPDHVPGEWAEEVHLTRDVPGAGAVPYLTPVPDLPAEYAAGAVHSPVLIGSDWAYLDKASEYVHGCDDLNRKPSVRGIRRALRIGQDRAERLLEHLGVEP